jgi:hypothetical protein
VDFLSFLSALQIVIPTDTTSLLIFLIVVLIVALVIIVFLGVLFAFPIAALAGILVWFLGGGIFWAAVTFLVVALICAVIGRIWRATRRREVEVHEHVYVHEHEHEEHEKQDENKEHKE